MPYALGQTISKSPIEGGIEISDQQYAEAFAAKVAGREALVLDENLVVRDPAPSPQHTWENGEWVAPPEPEPEQPTLEDMIAAKLAELDDYRWQIEVGGAAFGGVTIRTDWNSQAKVTAAYTMAKLDPDYSVPTWEVVPGVFMPLDNATIVAMGEAVRDHVQDTFNRKAVLHSQIAALETIDSVLAYDIPTEWNKG